jgi:hypothetical protein
MTYDLGGLYNGPRANMNLRCNLLGIPRRLRKLDPALVVTLFCRASMLSYSLTPWVVPGRQLRPGEIHEYLLATQAPTAED